ncbi:MAG: hypothetical protein PVF83_19510 [Anaerolineales bacterium]
MGENPCKDLNEELRKALEDWDLASKRASLPPSFKTVEEITEGIFLTPEMIKNLSKAAEERDKAWERLLKVNQAYYNCMKNRK